MRVRYTPEAFADRERIFAYLRERSPSGARNVLASIRQAVQLLRDQGILGIGAMAKAVLITKIGSIYDDLPEERYHFPRQYLGRMEACVGDWIIYYEPARLTVDSA
jgi:hypothetical protein